MPDALSKTIPIWCCVLNRALFPDQPAHHDLYVPPNAVSASEKSQMLARIPEGLDALRQLKLDLDSLRAQISKPLRPTWVTQETDLSRHHYVVDDNNNEGDGDDDDNNDNGVPKIFDAFRPVICCTSSKRVTDGEMSGHTGYIQGAGDDTENWAHGLTPPIFWAHADELLSAHEAELPTLIKCLVVASQSATVTIGAEGSTKGDPLREDFLPPTVRRLTPYLYVSPLPITIQDNDTKNKAQTSFLSSWCRISLLSTTTPPETWVQSPTQLDVGLGKHKAASRNLRVALANICDFVTQYLQLEEEEEEMESPILASSSFLTESSASSSPPLQSSSRGDKNEQTTHTSLSSSSPPSPPPTSQIKKQDQNQKSILIACETGGRDLSIGVALALLCWCFADDEGQVPTVAPRKKNTISSHQKKNKDSNDKDLKTASPASLSPPPLPPQPSFNKTMIKIRLGRIMTAMPDANPNRATLQSVNSFLMDWRK